MVFSFPPAPPAAVPSAILTFNVEATEAQAQEQRRLMEVDEVFGLLKGCGLSLADILSEHDLAAKAGM